MTTKGLSRKQVIVLMNADNILKFMKKSSLYISNINKALRNIKSNVSVNFICSDPLNITIVTCKIALLSDLQVIESYIKSINCINVINIKVPYLP